MVRIVVLIVGAILILGAVMAFLPFGSISISLPWLRLSGLTSEYAGDAAATAVIFGVAAAAWFGWAQEAPPQRWRQPLAVGALVGVATAVVGALLVWRDWGTGSAIDAQTGPIFGVVVGIEFAIAAAGSAVLIFLGRRELFAPWVALVVGVHFFFLAPLLQITMLHAVAALVTIGALLSVPVARTSGITTSAMTGVIVGSVLLVAGVLSLVS